MKEKRKIYIAHKVFVSYHHKNDQNQAEYLRSTYDANNTILDRSLPDAYNKWIDWEIYASLRPYGSRTRNGLLAIYLPSATETPVRLQDNIDSGYAVTMQWRDISTQLGKKVEEAYNKRFRDDLVRNWRTRRQHNS